MPTFSFLECDPAEGREPRKIERSYRIAGVPEEIERDGVTYALDLDRSLGKEIRQRRRDYARNCVRQCFSIPPPGFKGDQLRSMQLAPHEGREWLSKVPRTQRWSYDGEGIPVFTSNAQREAFCSASEGRWAWDPSSRDPERAKDRRRERRERAQAEF